MIHGGLVSVTFRKLSPQQIVDLVAKEGLEGIEWGGDVHVPHGDLAKAREVREATAKAGLSVAAYGSYYRAGHGEPCPFETVLATAVELGAPTIRVWAGRKASAQADAAYRAQVADDCRRAADLAAARGIVVAGEFHANTLTDANESTVDLLRAVGHPNFKTYWQPPGGWTTEHCQAGLKTLLPSLANLHVYYWTDQPPVRCELACGADAWRQYLSIAAGASGDRWAMIEFVKDDSTDAFAADAATLRQWLKK